MPPGEFSEILLPTLLGEPLFALDYSDTAVTLTALRTVAPKLPGDANRDGVVDDGDASILAANWLASSGATWTDGDFNDDGRVDDIDVTIMAANWDETSLGEGAVPGPSVLVLLAGVALGAWIVRRRHAC